MTLADSYFVYGGYGCRFKVHSDRPTRAVLYNIVKEPISNTFMEVYQVVPALGARWVIVIELRGWQTTTPQSRYYRAVKEKFEEVQGERAEWVKEQHREYQRRRAA